MAYSISMRGRLIDRPVRGSELNLTFGVMPHSDATTLEILELGRKGFINVSLSQEEITTQINSDITKLLSPPITPDTELKIKCGKCGKTGKENGVCIFGGCFTIIIADGDTKGSITWTF